MTGPAAESGGSPAEAVSSCPDDLAEFVLPMLHSGFYSRSDLVTAAEEYLEEPGSADVAEHVGRLWAERRAEEASWPAVTDSDRLGQAFAHLETSGVVARMCFTCCQGCGHLEIHDEVAEGADPIGYVFFHSQDADDLVGGSVYLAWGPFGDYPDEASCRAAMLHVADLVVAAVEAEGLSVEWDGSPSRRILVTGLDWRRRLPEG